MNKHKCDYILVLDCW